MSFDDHTDHIQNINYRYRGVKEVLNSLLETPIGFHQIFVYPNIDMLREIYFHYIKIILENNNEIVIFLPYSENAESVKNVLLSSFSVKKDNKNNSDSNSIDDNKDKGKGKNKKVDITIKDVNKYINNGSLVIIDSDNAFSNIQNIETITKKIKIEPNDQIDKDNNNNIDNNNNSNNNFLSLVRMSLYHANRLGKAGITIIAEYGSIYNNNNNKSFEDLLYLETSIPYFFEKMKIRQICLYNQKDFFDIFTKQQKKKILDLHSRSILMVE